MLDEEVLKLYGGAFNYLVVIGWIALFIVYEYGISRRIRKQIRSCVAISNTFKLLHSMVEISLVSLLIFYMADIQKMEIFLDSPLKLVYYLFLILSVLHLEKSVSLFTAILAAAQFAFISFYTFHLAGLENDALIRRPENSYYIECIVLIVSGIAASYVASEGKRKVTDSLQVQQAKNEIETMFGQQVSQEIVQALVNNKESFVKHEATVLAMDIRNFTKFAEQHSPLEIMDFQNRIFGPILDIIGEYGGVVNQIMGDGLMATFGTWVPNPNHAGMAFQAALKIREKVKELSKDGIIPFTRIGLGLHSGGVITGNIGNETRKQYSISGTAVIIAFRVEQLNKEFGSDLLITGEVSRRMEKTMTPLSHLGLKPIKGLEYEVDVYQAA